MSHENLSRRTFADVAFQGVNITKSIRPYFLSLTYTDNEEGEADDLQLRLQDREQIWQEKWLEDMVNAAASGQFKIQADIVQENWKGGGKDIRLPCGEFELDSVEASGPPSVVVVKSTALPFSSSVRQTKKTKAWESYSLRGIANEIAGANGLGCMYESSLSPSYDRVEQSKQSDIKFLERLCKDAGLSLKATDKTLVVFDQADYEKRPPVRTIRKGRDYLSYSLRTSTADTQYTSCRASASRAGPGWTIMMNRLRIISSLRLPPKCPAPARRKPSRKSTCGCITSFPKPQSLPFPGTRRCWRGTRWSWRVGARSMGNILSTRRCTSWTAAGILPPLASAGCWESIKCCHKLT